MKQQQEQLTAYTLAGIFTLSLRLIVGWTYFSAFWQETRPRKQTYPGFYRIHWREVQSFPT